MIEIHLPEIQVGSTPNFKYLNRYNSAENCSISLKYGRPTEFDHVTTDTLIKVQGQSVKIKGHSYH